jgi:hypothetical protein
MAYQVPPIAVPPQGTVLAGVTVVNPGLERQARCRVVVAGSCIDQVCRDPAGGGPFAGAYVLPGLIDMHVHIPPPARELTNLLFLVHGITTVRETGDADGTTWQGRARIKAGELPGPRILASGPVLDGEPPFLPTSWPVRDRDEARKAVAALAAQGSDFVKVHHRLSPEALAGIREAAQHHGLGVVGHVPAAVPFEQAGIWDVQHLDGLLPYPEGDETPLDYQRRWLALKREAVARYVGISAAQGLVHTPTLVSGESLVRLLEPGGPDEPAARLMPRYYRDGAWDRQRMPLFQRFSDDALALMRRGLVRSQEIVRALRQAGVRLHLGTDTAGMPFVVPGASLWREMRLMAGAGLSLAEIWEAGTRAAGKSLGVEGLGRIEVGAAADLLVFEEDPGRDLEGLSSLQAVVADGRLYTREALRQALNCHRDLFERPLYDRLSVGLTRLGTRMMVPG